jgi:hypothetical protein
VRITVLRAGTARVFDEVALSDSQSLEVAFSPLKGVSPCIPYPCCTCIFKNLFYTFHLE